MAGKASRGNTLAYGEFGLVATEPCWIKSNQIEAASALAMILHLQGSLCIARRNASRASSSGTPAISNITRPGLTTATKICRRIEDKVRCRTGTGAGSC